MSIDGGNVVARQQRVIIKGGGKKHDLLQGVDFGLEFRKLLKEGGLFDVDLAVEMGDGFIIEYRDKFVGDEDV